MADPLTPAVSDRICKHMNDDHADAVLLYAQVLGQTPEATAARLVQVDPQGMDLAAEVNGTSVPLRIAFDHTLQDSEDAHQTLIALVKAARQSQSV
jgi:putative heme iron utilization protein